MTDERRRHPRVKLNMLVQFRLQSYEHFLTDYASDVSTSGMFLRTREPKPEGTLLYFQFTTRDEGALIEGLGRVVRVYGDGTIEPVIENLPAPHGVAFDVAGNIYVAVYSAFFSGPDAALGQVARFDGIAAVG